MRTNWVLAMLVGFAVFRSAFAIDEPIHEGKAVSLWVKEYLESEGVNRNKARTAIMKIGPAALPYLIKTGAQMEQAPEDYSDGAIEQIVKRYWDRRSEAIPGLVELLTHESPTVREQASFMLARIGEKSDDLIVELRKLLDDPVPPVQISAAIALVVLDSETESHVEFLLRGLGSPNPAIRIKSAEALGLCLRHFDSRSPELKQKITQCLAQNLDDSALAVRTQAAITLVVLGADNERALPIAIEGLTCESEQIRTANISSLARAGPRVIPSLIEAFSTVDDQDAIDQIGYVLFVIGEQHRGETRTQAPAVIKLLHHEDVRVRIIASQVFSNMVGYVREGDMDEFCDIAIPALKDALSDPNDGVRLVAADALASLNVEHELALPVLLNAMKDESGAFSAFVVSAVGRYGPKAKAAVPLLIEALNLPLTDDSIESVNGIHVAAVTSLAQMGAEASPAVRTLCRILCDKSAEAALRFAVIAALESIKPHDEEAIATIVALLSDSEERQYYLQAARAVGGIGPAAKVAIPVLTELLSDKENLIRRAAAAALKKIQSADEP